MVTILERELTARGVQSLRHSECMEIVESLVVRLKERDQDLAARIEETAPARRVLGQVRPGPLRQHEGESWRGSKPGNDARFLRAR
jgi:hypothetical protein